MRENRRKKIGVTCELCHTTPVEKEWDTCQACVDKYNTRLTVGRAAKRGSVEPCAMDAGHEVYGKPKTGTVTVGRK